MLRVHTLSRPGRGANNEDALTLEPHPRDADLLLLALADGQGGQPGGGPAARLAVSTILEAARQHTPEALKDPAAWPPLLARADQRVRETPETGFTTLLAAALSVTTLAGAANGDGALVAVDPGQRRLLTEQVPRNPPVGCGRAAIAPFGGTLTAPWLVVAASDGVWKFAGLDALLDIDPGMDPQRLAYRLQSQARRPGTLELQDDFTLAVIQSPG